MHETPQPRRWFRISLRTFFVVITLLCVWLGWEISIVSARRAELKRIQADGKYRVTTATDWNRHAANFPGVVTPAKKISAVRRVLGDEAIHSIMYTWAPPTSEVCRLSIMFPEATIDQEPPQEPCHPGCFPRGTLVLTPQGTKKIEEVKPGDVIVSIDAQGNATEVAVQSVFVTENRLWEIETDEETLVTTETQPLCLTTDRVVPAGELQAGDTIQCYRAGKLSTVRVLSVVQTVRRESVFNVILGNSETFVANGFLARSKPPESAVPLP